MIASLLTLTACGKTLDSENIAQRIQQDVIRQGGISLKTVTCPGKIEPESGERFECIGEIDTGYTFTIPVKQQDDQGRVTWDVPNAKGLLNVAKFETTLQEAVQAEIGSRPIIRCGDGFKPIKPGQIFECKLEVKEKVGDPKGSKVAGDARKPAPSNTPQRRTGKNLKPETIVVSVGADGNVSWQRVLPGAVSELSPKPAEKSTRSANREVPSTQSSVKPASKPAANPEPPAQKSAEDFLNQPGASDQFED
ncbi:DUF4333 domain-containing protein [Kovacikia minuta CCNUW1]|uniref:DUF4333 domain-containing protein n=1 Tax=Kovacikia minuta TaxID=2931930 RepID=UPI001CCD82AB|nr:DUF4333 domain-containing protein [Kovacikia minuta]UBF26254.1 DUF4333 domain-containing protein [Kovacikia minuta CCNUW1]